LPHQVRQHAEDAHGSQEGRHSRKQPDHLHAKPGIGRRAVEEWLVDGIAPDRWDLLGVGVTLVGMSIIAFAPRG
jgi:hypothetical protein